MKPNIYDRITRQIIQNLQKAGSSQNKHGIPRYTLLYSHLGWG